MYESQRKAMTDIIRARGVTDQRVLDALMAVQRHIFVLKRYEQDAYRDTPLPIGYDQTISQPFTVAFMLAALELDQSDVVLEIGTGSGYNSACLSLLCHTVVSIETIPELVQFARSNLSTFKNVQVIEGDGATLVGGHFEKIISTCSSDRLMPVWKQQLQEGGIFVGPIGTTMVKAVKKNGALHMKNLGEFVFVPLT